MSFSGSAADQGRTARSAKGGDYRGALWFGLAVVTLAGLALRLYHLDADSLAHTEIYVPGLDLPPGISEPPPRHGFAETLSFHFHTEPHPMGWYLLMWAWTSLAGATEWTVRLPPAVFGTLGILAVAGLAGQIYGRGAAVLAAAMLALHGLHIHWSQAARMYTSGALWCTLSLVLVAEIARSRQPRPWLECAYVASVFAALQSTELAWVVVGLQVAWAMLLLPMPAGRRPMRLLQVQALALMLAAPGLLHAIYRARRDPVEASPLAFISEYLSAGFLFAPSRWTMPPTAVPTLAAVALFLGSAALILLGLARRDRMAGPAATDVPRALPRPLLPAVAVAVAALMVALAAIALRRQTLLAATASLPLAALSLPWLARAIRGGIVDRIVPLRRMVAALDPWITLLALVALAGPLVLFAASPVVLLLADRAFLVFVPALIALMAGGATWPWRSRPVAALLPAVILAVFALSVAYNARFPHSPNDYKALASQVRAQMQPGDLVFVTPQSWVDTPFLYYLRDADFVTGDYAAALAAAPSGRVWVITWPDNAGKTIPGDWVDAIAPYQPALTVEALRARAELYLVGGAP